MIDIDSLWRRVVAGASRHARLLHGVSHWARVERNGVYLARRTAGASELIVRLFAVFHDCMRLNESTDPDHGRRGAEYARGVRGELAELPDDQFEKLCYACEWHTGRVGTDDPVVGVCWDADRLDLPRAGIQPEPKYMFSDTAKQIAATRGFHLLDEIPLRDFSD